VTGAGRGPDPAPVGAGGAPSPPEDPAHVLGPEWQPGPDGLLFRRGARVILLDDDDRVLLLRGHDVDEPGRRWWFTVGGGIDAGESDRDAAVREVLEETGLLLTADDLDGPVFTRSAIFDFFARTCRQDEVFFLARLTGPASLSTSGWTDVERRVVDDLRWWPLDELARVTEEVFPAGLADLVSGLLGGWDGRTRHLGLASSLRARRAQGSGRADRATDDDT
jgi:8-oxo-dGTP pyrophosphatase MutT (NUDIX family)